MGDDTIFEDLAHREGLEKDLDSSARWLNRECWDFALALEERISGELVGLREAVGQAVHVGLRIPSGAYLDARGLLDEAKFKAGFGVGLRLGVVEQAVLLKHAGLSGQEPPWTSDEIDDARIAVDILLERMPEIEDEWGASEEVSASKERTGHLKEVPMYIDDRGVEMPLNIEDALETVVSLARQGIVDADRDPDMKADETRQTAAVDMIEDFATNFEDLHKQRLQIPDRSTDWTVDLVLQAPMDDPTLGNAFCTTINLARQQVMDPEDVEGVDLADEVDRQLAAISMVQELFVQNRDILDPGTSAPDKTRRMRAG